ncbi:glycosyltransferase family A protein [Pedobacter sp. PWIIR3]
MTTTKPQVTVLIATFNYKLFIGYAIESIINQSYPKESIQIVIVDDGSKDGTEDVVSGYFDKIEIKYFYQENKGKAFATRFGVEQSTGKYLFILDADDYYLSDCIETVVNEFEKNIDVVQVSHAASRLDEETGTSVPQLYDHSYLNIPFDGIEILKANIFKGASIGLGSTFACRMNILKEIDIRGEVDMYIDFYMFLKVAPKGKVIQLNRILSVFRRHPRSYSEGNQKFEKKAQRTLRYYESARALYLDIKDSNLDLSVKKSLELFYFQHRLSAQRFSKKISKSSCILNILRLVLQVNTFHEQRLRFLKNNIRPILRYQNL